MSTVAVCPRLSLSGSLGSIVLILRCWDLSSTASQKFYEVIEFLFGPLRPFNLVDIDPELFCKLFVPTEEKGILGLILRVDEGVDGVADHSWGTEDVVGDGDRFVAVILTEGGEFVAREGGGEVGWVSWVREWWWDDGLDTSGC